MKKSPRKKKPTVKIKSRAPKATKKSFPNKSRLKPVAKKKAPGKKQEKNGLLKVIDFLEFIRDNYADDIAKEALKNARQMQLPLMKLFEHLPEESLIEQSKKGQRDFINNLKDGTYIEKQRANLKLWEEDKLPGISRDSITLTDLVMMDSLQKRGYFKYLPLYTTDSKEAISILQALDDINFESRKEAFDLMFKLTRQSEEKMHETLKRLKRTNDFLDSVLENIPSMVFVKDAKELRFVRFNKAGEQMLGVPGKELMGKNDYDFFPKEQADFFTAKDRDALKSDDVVDIPEEPIDTKNGKRWLHTRKITLKDVDGNPIYLVGISVDITEERIVAEQVRSLNDELKQNVRQLEMVNKELDAFSYSVSHDLRAPLRAIHGYSKILQDDYRESLDEEANSMLDSVMSNTIKMGQLIDDLLAFSRLGKAEMDIMETSMYDIAREALEEVKEAVGDKFNARITINPLLPAKVDHNLIELVFLNLISNAVKYSAKNKTPQVEVGSYTKDGENIYYVKDNGVGFDMKYYDKLFGVFQRLHSSSEFEGTGVGLALVKRIITRHGGRVWAEAKPAEGAVFYFALRS